MRRSRSVFLRIAVAALLTSVAIVAEEGSCRVVVNVTDNFGVRVQADHIRLTTDSGATEVSQDQPVQAKCGRHTLTVEARGANPQSLSVDIDQVEQVVAVALGLGAVDGPVPDCTILGQVTGKSSPERVRLVQLFGSHVVDVPVTATNTFRFVGVECGAYLLLAMRGKECLGTQTLTATVSGTPIALKVGDTTARNCSLP